ncbi:MAG: phosphoribosylanthranilate isomerase [Paracoccaceae bacterium]
MLVKICGLTTERHVKSAAAGGARYLGFVFYPKSPRNLSVERAQELMLSVPEGICKVALTVDAGDEQLDRIVSELPVDMLQLHGSEGPDRVTAVRRNFGLPVMKALGVADAADLSALSEYSRVADQLLVDAKPPRTSELPGGNGLSFDWRLIADRRWPVPWMLAGGLTPDNVAEAIRLTGAKQVDVSSGVESAPGVKDEGLMAAFLRSAGASDATK